MSTLSPCVIDASVLIKLSLQEEHTADVRYIIQCYMNEEMPGSLAIPDFCYIECANILWKHVRKQSMTQSLARLALAQLRQLEIPTTPMSELMERAHDIACFYDISAYDASYIALAERQAMPLITADERLIQKLSGSPFRLMRIPEYLNALPI